jgi:hypothetical protein
MSKIMTELQDDTILSVDRDLFITRGGVVVASFGPSIKIETSDNGDDEWSYHARLLPAAHIKRLERGLMEQRVETMTREVDDQSPQLKLDQDKPYKS